MRAGLFAGFNPTLVRFEPKEAFLASVATQGFNPTLVRFEPAGAAAAGAGVGCFNPTLVRFEQFPNPHLPQQRMRFNPTLVRFEPWPTRTTPTTAAVSIPHWSDLSAGQEATAWVGWHGFNPTLVRFEPPHAQGRRGGNAMFQSHIGPI